RAGGRQARDLLLVDMDAVRRDEVAAEEPERVEHPRAGRAGGLDEELGEAGPRAAAVHQVVELGTALGDVRRDREAQAGGGLVDGRRSGEGCVRRDAGADEVPERRPGALVASVEELERFGWIRPEDLQVDDRAQPEARARDGGRAAE